MPGSSPTRGPMGSLLVIVIGLLLLASATVLLAPSLTCAPFRLADLWDPGELPVPLPPHCGSTTEEPSDATARSLENQRQQAHLTLQESITCKISSSASHTRGYDPLWTQKMYVGGALRYKRHVLLAATQEVP